MGISDEIELIKKIDNVIEVEDQTGKIYIKLRRPKGYILIRKKGKPWFRIFRPGGYGMYFPGGGICLDGSGVSRKLYTFFKEGQFYMAVLYLLSYIKYNTPWTR